MARDEGSWWRQSVCDGRSEEGEVLLKVAHSAHGLYELTCEVASKRRFIRAALGDRVVGAQVPRPLRCTCPAPRARLEQEHLQITSTMERATLHDGTCNVSLIRKLFERTCRLVQNALSEETTRGG
jgi:hypothetical protein